MAPGEPALSARVRVSPSGCSGARASRGGPPTAICSCSGLHVHESSCISPRRIQSQRLNSKHINGCKELHDNLAAVVAARSHVAF